MKKNVTKLFVLALALTFFVACQKEDFTTNSQDSVESANLKKGRMDKGFVHGITVNFEGEKYYLAGKPDGLNSATDIPGHYWVQAGPNRLVGKHYNTGPFGAPGWWSSDAGDGELLYIVKAIIDTWSPENAEFYASRGYVHYHMLVNVSTGKMHPTKVPWLKHTAVSSFNFDGGPHPEFGHEVTPGLDVDFIPNGMMPYMPPQ